LSVFYQYVRTAALNQQQQTQHVSVFTTELFAHYLHIRCLLVMKCRRLTQTSSTNEVQRYRKCLYDLREMYITDVLFLRFMARIKYPANDQRHVIRNDQYLSGISHELDTSELVELLRQSALEHLTTFRQLAVLQFSFADRHHSIITTDFEALYAYKYGDYQRCLQLSRRNVRMPVGYGGLSPVLPMFPEFIHFMYDDVVSLTGLMLIVNPSFRQNPGHYRHVMVDQFPLSLCLMTLCQIKLHHPVTSLAQTLQYVEVADRLLEGMTLDQLLLKLTERKILLYSRQLAQQ